MDASVQTPGTSIPGLPPALAELVAPPLDLSPFTRDELWYLLRGVTVPGEADAEDLERFLASGARARGAIDVAVAEGLDALRDGNRLVALAYHLEDYGREVLGLGERATRELARRSRSLSSPSPPPRGCCSRSFAGADVDACRGTRVPAASARRPH